MDETLADATNLKGLLKKKDLGFWTALTSSTLAAKNFHELQALSTLRKKALAQGLPPADGAQTLIPLRLAIVGGFTFHPLCELIQHMLFARGFDVSLWTGEYDNYAWEIMEESSALYSFKPDFVVLMPAPHRYRYTGNLLDDKATVEQKLADSVNEIWNLCRQVNEQGKAEVIFCNFLLPSYHDPGPIRSRSLASEWSSLKWLNLNLGLSAPAYVHICDIEFLGARLGGLSCRSDRAWFESKQPFAPGLAFDVTLEIVHLIHSAKQPTKKVLVLDLDQTLWGGVIGEDGLNGIEIGDISPRGQSYKEFQRSILELHQRGILLAVCSKNNFENAIEPFEKHPEMVLRKEHIASFKANWNPKSENIREIAEELSLSYDSFVFVDDNPAEIDIVQQFTKGVSTILLDADPSAYVKQLKDSRLFEPRQITREDLIRAEQYQHDQQRKVLQSSITDFDSYLESLDMKATISEFTPIDVPRLAQLINKSNQFNLTTKRRTEAEVASLIDQADNVCLSLRLQDRFGDLGLVSIVIAAIESDEMLIDTWLMSCRVLKRQVENYLMNDVIRRAHERDIRRVIGCYIPSQKNSMVSDFYEQMSFRKFHEDANCIKYDACPTAFAPFDTKIKKLIC